MHSHAANRAGLRIWVDRAQRCVGNGASRRQEVSGGMQPNRGGRTLMRRPGHVEAGVRVEDEEEFRRFVAARSRALLRTAYLLTGSQAGAEDLLQTALGKTHRMWTRLESPAAYEAYVRTTLARTAANWWRRGQTKTFGSDAILPLPEICVAALKIRAEEREKERINAGDTWTESGLVISTRFGTPFEPRNFNRQFAARCAKAGVRSIRVHDTRRTCASLWVALDLHPRVAMQILRHSQIAVTMKIYSEVPSSATREALRRLGETLAG